MGCPRAPEKRFLFFTYEGPHRWLLMDISSMGHVGKWRVDYRCEHCCARMQDKWVEDEELIRMGIPMDEVYEKCRDTTYLAWHPWQPMIVDR